MWRNARVEQHKQDAAEVWRLLHESPDRENGITTQNFSDILQNRQELLREVRVRGRLKAALFIDDTDIHADDIELHNAVQMFRATYIAHVRGKEEPYCCGYFTRRQFFYWVVVCLMCFGVLALIGLALGRVTVQV